MIKKLVRVMSTVTREVAANGVLSVAEFGWRKREIESDVGGVSNTEDLSSLRTHCEQRVLQKGFSP